MSGRAVASATSPGAAGSTCNPPSSTVGSGPPPARGSSPRTVVKCATGPAQEGQCAVGNTFLSFVIFTFQTFSLGQPQPDNREFRVNFDGEEEACVAILNNFYGVRQWRRNVGQGGPEVATESRGLLFSLRRTYKGVARLVGQRRFKILVKKQKMNRMKIRSKLSESSM